MTEEETKRYHLQQRQFLDKLLEQLRLHETNGLTWKYLSKRTGPPIVIFRHPHPSHIAYLKIVEVAVLEGEIYVPSARFHLESANPPGTLVSADFAEIVSAILKWRDQFGTKSESVSSPIGQTEIAWLSAIAKARLQAKGQAESLVVLDKASFGASNMILVPKIAERILWNFPRDDDGRLPLNASVILAPYGDGPHTENNRCAWLAATSPEKRRDPQVITVALRALIAENHPHRWESVPWIWDPATPEPLHDEPWAIPPLPYDRLGLSDRDQNLVHLTQDRIAQCILLQDAGRFGDAFALMGVECDVRIWDILHGQPPHPGYQDLMPSWMGALRHVLWECAPWRFEHIVATMPQKGKKPIKFRLLGLPGQTQQSKMSLMLTGNPKSLNCHDWN